MSVPLRSLFLAAVLAGPLTVASATVVNTPTFACIDEVNPDAGGAIYWSTGIAVVAPTVATSIDGQVSTTSAINCSDGGFNEPLARPSKDREYLIVKLNDVFITSAGSDLPPTKPPPPPPPPKKFELDTSSGSPILWDIVQQQVVVDDVTYTDTFFNVYVHYVAVTLDNLAITFDRSSNFLGLQIRTQGIFTGLDSVLFDYDVDERALLFQAPLQDADSRLSFYGRPVAAVAEPGTLGLLLTALLGIAASTRRRRSPVNSVNAL